MSLARPLCLVYICVCLEMVCEFLMYVFSWEEEEEKEEEELSLLVSGGDKKEP